MQSSKKVSPELLGIDQALQRAAVNAKLQAERQGLPYVVSREASTGQFVSKNKSVTKAK
ncbi:hypothetical protein [Methylotenera sp. N17]|uniref:hypothetical protein n=1 Tax=Methylotenera sp. N17 TaxID=1502761 RepID=UPI000AD16789|nr:hypothetical protein [Methylotenera sp. N17]